MIKLYGQRTRGALEHRCLVSVILHGKPRTCRVETGRVVFLSQKKFSLSTKTVRTKTYFVVPNHVCFARTRSGPNTVFRSDVMYEKIRSEIRSFSFNIFLLYMIFFFRCHKQSESRRRRCFERLTRNPADYTGTPPLNGSEI